MSIIDSGNIATIPGSAGALDASMFGDPIYVGNYGSLVLNIGGSSYNGVLTPQGTNTPDDSGSWQTLKMTDLISLDAGDTSSAGFDSVTNRVFGCIRTYLYFRLKMTSYTSGTAEGILQLYKDGLPGLALQYAYTRSQFGHIIRLTSGTVLASGAVTSDGTSADFLNSNARGIRLYIVPGSFGSGASTITVTLQERDLVSGGYTDILTSAALVASTPVILKLYPGVTPAANQAVSDFLPVAWRVKWAASDWGSGGSTLGINYVLSE